MWAAFLNSKVFNWFMLSVNMSRIYHPVSCFYPRGFVQVHSFRIKAFILNSCLHKFKLIRIVWGILWVGEHIPRPKINKSANLYLNLSSSVDIINNKAAPDVQLGQRVKTLQSGQKRWQTIWLLSSPKWLWICKPECDTHYGSGDSTPSSNLT